MAKLILMLPQSLVGIILTKMDFFMNRAVALTLFFALSFSLAGCDGFFKKSISDICSESSELCADLNEDSWCRAEKAKIIKARYKDVHSPSDENTYRLLTYFESYKTCIDKAAQIEHIKLKEKKTDRVEGALAARSELKRLARETQDSDNPYLLYYHWSRFNRSDALEQFLSYQRTGELETPELQVALASHFVKFDRIKALEILEHALELYNEGDELDSEIFQSLATLYLKEEDIIRAYVWGSIAEELEGSTDVDLVQIESLIRSQKRSPSGLKKLALQYLEDIENGEFVRPL